MSMYRCSVMNTENVIEDGENVSEAARAYTQ